MAKWAIKNPPEKKGRYLVTVKNGFGYTVRQADRYQNPCGDWLWCLLPEYNICSDVIAWQKQPKPYDEEVNNYNK